MQCGKQIRSMEKEYCYDCMHTHHYYEQGLSLWNHKAPVNQSIYQFKYHNQRRYGELYSQELVKNFQKEILNSDKPVLLDFWASWCGPCRMVSPLVDEIADEHPEFTVGKVNVDEQPELAAQFNVMSIPSLFVLKNGKIVNQAMGARPKQQILAMMNK